MAKFGCKMRFLWIFKVKTCKKWDSLGPPLKCCVFVFNILHGTCPDYLRDIIQRKPLQQRSLRSNNDNLLFTTSLHQKTVYNSMVINWNALPFSLRSITSIELFKSNLKTYYFNIAYNTWLFMLFLINDVSIFEWPDFLVLGLPLWGCRVFSLGLLFSALPKSWPRYKSGL